MKVACKLFNYKHFLTSKSFCFLEYIAMYTYESSEQGDLTFQQGDLILVTKKDGDWWTGMLGEKSGVFPSNYVRLKDSEVKFIHVCLLETISLCNRIFQI